MDDPRTLVASSRATDVTPLAAAELSGVTSPQPITLGVRTSTSNGTNNNNCKKNNKKNKDTSVEDSTPVYNLYDVLSYSIPDVAGPVSDGATTAPCVDMGAQHPLVGALNGPALVRVSGSASRSAASAALPCSAGVHEGIRSAAACVGTSGKAAAAREVASGSTASVSASGADTVAEARGVAPSSGAIVVSLGAAESGYSSLQVGLPFSSCSPTRDPLRDGFSWHWGVATLSDASAAPSSTLLLPARINGVAVSGLLDSGATHSLVSHVVAQRLNLPVRGADLHRSMVLANGGLLDVVGFAACSIEIGSARLNCEIIVVPSLSYELIFGMDVLRRLKAVASFASGKLSSSLLSSSLNLIPCFPSAVPSGASASADASSNDPLLNSLVADPSPADPADSLLPDAIDYKDLQDAWDPSAWPTAAAKALDGCLWPDSHRKLLEEFKDVFAAKAGAPGLARVEPFRILTTTPVPVARRGAPHSHHDRAIINKSVDEMLAAGIIRPSTSSYCSPVVLVPKPDGSSRFCVDYRGLNAVTVPDKFPMPLARDIFDGLGGFAAFNIMDLASGFFQIPIHPDDAHLTAFQCDTGLFEFVCLPFGVMNGPAVFCRVIVSLFHGMGKNEVASFVDDLISPAKDEGDSLQKLRLIFARLRSVGLKLRLDKCKFGRRSATFLGHRVSPEGLAVNESKVDAVAKLAPPSSVLQVRQFLGLAGYYRSFIPMFAEIAQPLFKLTRHNARFSWSSECEAAFEWLRQELSSACVLAFPDFARPFLLATDASRSALGAILSQDFGTPDRPLVRPIAFASRSLKPAEMNYTIFELECLAIVWGVRYFHSYLHGRHFLIESDHRALAFLRASPESVSPRVERWMMALQRYSFTVRHRPAKEHAHVDALSRLPVVATVSGVPTVPPFSLSELVDAQRTDATMSFIMSFLVSGEQALPASPEAAALVRSQAAACLIDSKGRLCVLREGVSHVWVPPTMVPKVLRAAHDELGHLGADRCLERLTAICFWSSMAADVANWCRSCPACARAVTHRSAPAGLLQPISSSAPLDLVVMDYITSLPVSSLGNKHIFLFMDHFSKWVVAIPVPAADGDTTVRLLIDRLLCTLGCPSRLLSDNGTHFINSKVNGLCAARGIEFVHGLPYHSQTQGLIERFNATLYDMLKKHVSADQTDWDVHLPWLLWSYNTSVHSSTGVSPFQVLHGIPPPAPTASLERPSSAVGAPAEFAETVRVGVRATSETVASALADAALRAKTQYDKGRRDVSFAKGDFVMVYTPQPRKGLSPKFQSLWSGPYQVEEVVNDINLRVNMGSKSSVVPITRVKPSVLRTVSVPSSVFVAEPAAAEDSVAAPDPATAPVSVDVDPAAVAVPAVVVENATAPAVPDAVADEAAPAAPPLDPYIPGHDYEIESLVDRKPSGRGRSYRVRWTGFGSEFDEWIARSNLPRHLVDAYDRDHPLPVPADPPPPPPGTRSSARLRAHPQAHQDH